MIHSNARAAALLPLLLLPLGACGDDDDPVGVPDTETFAYSFEDDLAGWSADGTDLQDPEVTWSVERTDARAQEGDASAMIFLDNVNDQAKVWMERSFELEPNTTYDVDVSYDFASEDWGTVNLWTLFTNATPEDPESWSDFEGAATGTTGNGATDDTGYVWMDKDVTFQATTDGDGRLWVAIGVWGTYEVQRSYFFDEVDITFTER